MTRSKGFLPSVPLEYRGIEVCDHVANRWIAYEGTMWRMGVDQALESVTELVSKHVTEVTSNVPMFFIHEWAEGAQYGREDALEELTDDMKKYNKHTK